MNNKIIKPKALIFDVGDILYDASQWRRWLTTELNQLGIKLSYDQLVHDWERLLVAVYKGQAEYWDAFEDLLSSCHLNNLQKESLKSAAQEKGKAVQVDRKPMPGVPETLRQLQSDGIKLVALSDSESGETGIRKTLKQLDIEQYFDAVVSSIAIGHVKPEPEAFDFAIQQTGHDKSECGFVAHDIDELEGAQKHQLFSIGYNYHPDAPADVFIEDFPELLTLTK